MQTIIINPGLAFSNIDLECFANATDDDDQPLTYVVEWYLNGVLSVTTTNTGFTQGALSNIANLSATIIQENDTWTCQAYAYDGYDNSINTLNYNITISPDYITEPTITNPSTDGYPIQDYVNLTWNESISIGLPVNNYTVEILNQDYTINYTVVSQITSTNYYFDVSTIITKEGIYHFRVIANDTEVINSSRENLYCAIYEIDPTLKNIFDEKFSSLTYLGVVFEKNNYDLDGSGKGFNASYVAKG